MWKNFFPDLVLIDLMCESQASASTELTSDRLRKGNDELCSMTVEQLKPFKQASSPRCLKWPRIACKVYILLLGWQTRSKHVRASQSSAVPALECEEFV